jgi:hypothetical protein
VALPVAAVVEPEPHLGLSAAPVGSVEVANGTFPSIALNHSLRYRVFSPASPSWPPEYNHTDVDSGSDGMRIVVYVMNLTGVPRPSKASDTAIIQGLIQDGFLVAVVDYEGARIQDPLVFQKDVCLLYFSFGGNLHFPGSSNYMKLMEMRGPYGGWSSWWHDADRFSSFPFPGNASKRIPINMGAVYVIPSGYTVAPQVIVEQGFVIGKSFPRDGHRYIENAAHYTNVTKLFVDIIFPKASPGTERVPLLLEGTTCPLGDFAVNTNTVVLFAWLFNGYALASMNYVDMEPGTPGWMSAPSYVNDTASTQAHTIRYLRSQSERFSLSGKVGTAGLSKSNLRTYVESNPPRNSTAAAGRGPHQPSDVCVTMPAMGFFGGPAIWDHLVDRSTAHLVLTYAHLNTYGLNGTQVEQLRDDYLAAGLQDKLLYIDEPLAGHEYNVYHLKEIMAFFDRFCKP